MSTQIVKVPDIGGAEGVEVIDIFVAVGDEVALEDSLVVLESDKASMEIPSPFAGKVVSISISNGDNLREGDAILEMDVDGQVQQETVDVEEPAAVAQTSVPDESENNSEPKQELAAAVQAHSIETVYVPDIGSDDAEVIEICVNVADNVSEGDSLIVLETDKASMEVPTPNAGKVVSVTVKEGDKVAQGASILELEVAAVSAATEPTTAQEPTASAPQAVTAKTTQKEQVTAVVSEQSDNSEIPAPAFASLQRSVAERRADEPKTNRSVIYAGPAVRKLARELGVELSQVRGTGPKGRIAKDDLKAHVKTALQGKSTAVKGAGIPPIPSVDFAAYGDIDIEPLSKIQKLTASNMQRNWLNIPHVTQFDDADISDLEDFRQSLKAEAANRGVKITPLPFLLKACAYVLKKYPKFNASLHSDTEHLVLKKYVHIGIAVDTAAGLLVPVIRDIDKKSIWELAQEAAELAAKAKDRKLTPTQMQGSCFTISSLGGIGGQGFTPIVNAPEVAILGVSKLAVKPVWNGNEFIPRKMLPLALSYDHRAINGVDGGQFLTELTHVLSDIRHLSL